MPIPHVILVLKLLMYILYSSEFPQIIISTCDQSKQIKQNDNLTFLFSNVTFSKSSLCLLSICRVPVHLSLGPASLSHHFRCMWVRAAASRPAAFSPGTVVGGSRPASLSPFPATAAEPTSLPARGGGAEHSLFGQMLRLWASDGLTLGKFFTFS